MATQVHDVGQGVRILGVDPSTHTGICALERAKTMEVPRIWAAYEVPKPDGKGLPRARLIASAVESAAVKHNPNVVMIEGYAFANRDSLAMMVEIGTLIRDRLWKSGFQWVDVAPTQLKKFVLGKGAGKKDQMRLGVYKRWGFEHESDNVVDAYGLAAIGLALMEQMPGLIQPQIEVISKLPVPVGTELPRRAT